ncbi:hypothetical protein NPIL_696221 [Nephila pilipes]|uniref:Uncharacterized protein n=1 Tax=Nephila pilipes TaxID=299642 RepID=A0A8X6IV51_NEPPI|nr:hypothetical protein NPIL_696221 [Nephila pilipes]
MLVRGGLSMAMLRGDAALLLSLSDSKDVGAYFAPALMDAWGRRSQVKPIEIGGSTEVTPYCEIVHELSIAVGRIGCLETTSIPFKRTSALVSLHLLEIVHELSIAVGRIGCLETTSIPLKIPWFHYIC